MGNNILKANPRVGELAYQLIIQVENQVMEHQGPKSQFHFTIDDSFNIVLIPIKNWKYIIS